MDSRKIPLRERTSTPVTTKRVKHMTTTVGVRCIAEYHALLRDQCASRIHAAPYSAWRDEVRYTARCDDHVSSVHYETGQSESLFGRLDTSAHVHSQLLWNSMTSRSLLYMFCSHSRVTVLDPVRHFYRWLPYWGTDEVVEHLLYIFYQIFVSSFLFI